MLCVGHKWKHIKDVVIEEKLSKMDTHSRSMVSYKHTQNRELAKQGVISILRCEICGKIKHVKTRF